MHTTMICTCSIENSDNAGDIETIKKNEIRWFFRLSLIFDFSSALSVFFFKKHTRTPLHSQKTKRAQKCKTGLGQIDHRESAILYEQSG